MTAHLLEIIGDVRDYAWGTPGGVSRALGRPATDEVEAELWLGAHPSAPSRIVDADAAGATDLAAWERSTGTAVPFLLKLLSASSPLSLQAHPTTEQAVAGFAAEEAAGVARDARERNYKDASAKPELIVALEDGFEGLCGFRPLPATLEAVAVLAETAEDPAPFAEWERMLRAEDGVRTAFDWLLSGGPAVESLVRQVTAAAEADPARFELPGRLAAGYPADPGIAIALMLNHVTLQAGECLWLPAGNIHAYLRGTGMELMGPSDNVLRGGLTPKHVDVPELRRVLDFSTGEPPHLAPARVSENVVAYRPASLPSGRGVAFALLAVTGDDVVTTSGPAIGIVVDGAFTVTAGDEAIELPRGGVVFVTDAATLDIRGDGRFFLAAG
ncbi:mannose-6-phosphate isomerase, class I [Microbacterium thalassium]|uniref:mannose-6-phosphate isomerase n=1 Tax=Microbacterium thalassium TaxID=362649 RepID=A0A7X0FML8_9MICO|nr:mannose-6-phosphate isomerase, class I [Microbacterium thalassium]MBB6389767.1 mannose-6-phosphate isomerase [Microbacterium thalassium]GLK24455.1 putative mannose-6-phosphate isomerase ManA [Microbacterium thalassium]